MSDYYHRWEPLAEFHFNIENDELYDEDNYIYCLCSRVFIRDGVKTYYVDKEVASESETEVAKYSQSQECEDQSHVHFSIDTKDKCQKDESASCYCSASHTDNYCSTDEHDLPQIQGNVSHALQPSDSGADLTYPDYHSDCTADRLDQDDKKIIQLEENYLSEDSWDKFWAVNGERLIWASWIKKYSDYINPGYFDENKEILLDDNGIPKQHSFDEIYSKENNQNIVDIEESVRERKFSYDSKVNPYKKSLSTQNSTDKNEKTLEGNVKDENWLLSGRKRSCSEHDRMLSPRTIAGTDSMTNVTKITLSSYDVTSSYVTSESSPTDDYSVSSNTSDDVSNDQTKIANIDDSSDKAGEDAEEYWQLLWKKHFGDQYALHYAIYLETHNAQTLNILPIFNIDTVPKKSDEEFNEIVDCNSNGESPELPTVVDVENQIDEIQLEDKKDSRSRKKNKKSNYKYMNSIGLLLQNLLREEENKKVDSDIVETNAIEKVSDTGETSSSKSKTVEVDSKTSMTDCGTKKNTSTICNENNACHYEDDGGDDPPEYSPFTIKRRHEMDSEEDVAEKIKSTFQIMGFSFDTSNLPKGELVYRKKLMKLRPPRQRRNGAPRKTYFDDDGNPYEVVQEQNSQEENEMQMEKLESCSATDVSTLDPSSDFVDTPKEGSSFDVPNKSDGCALDQMVEAINEAANTALPTDADSSVTEDKVNDEEILNREECESQPPAVSSEGPKRRKRPKRRPAQADYSDILDISDAPQEIQLDPKMLKYWKKRHSLFHRFDEGIRLDHESWFSVTPESVARHIAEKCNYDVVVDAFCGAAGNTIQFAQTCNKVIAIDIDPAKIELARHNAAVYGVSDYVEFVVGDFFQLAPTLSADLVFLSPPWGGPAYSDHAEYDLERMLEPRPASQLMEAARQISSNVALYLPRNSRADQILALAQGVGGSVEVEQNYLDRRFVAITAYYY